MTAANDASGGAEAEAEAGKGTEEGPERNRAVDTRKPADPARPTRDDAVVAATLVRDAVARIVASGGARYPLLGRAAANEPPP